MASDGRTPRDKRGASTIEPTEGETPPESRQDVDAPPGTVVSAGSDEAASVAVGADAAPIEPAPETPPPEPSPPEPPPPPVVRERPPRRRIFWPMLGSAVLGAILALGALAFMWRFNVLEPYKIGIGGKLLSPRLAALEARVRDSRPAPAPAAPVPLAAPAPANTKALDELAARIAKLEAAPAPTARPAAPDPAVTNKLNSLEAAMKPLDEAVAANDKRD